MAWITALWGSRKWIGMGFGVLALAGAVWYVWSLQGERDDALAQKALLEGALAAQSLELERAAGIADEWARTQAELETALGELEDVRKEAQQARNDLERLFREHDLGALAKARPETIERLVNADTIRMFQRLDAATDLHRRSQGTAGNPADTDPGTPIE